MELVLCGSLGLSRKSTCCGSSKRFLGYSVVMCYKWKVQTKQYKWVRHVEMPCSLKSKKGYFNLIKNNTTVWRCAPRFNIQRVRVFVWKKKHKEHWNAAVKPSCLVSVLLVMGNNDSNLFLIYLPVYTVLLIRQLICVISVVIMI